MWPERGKFVIERSDLLIDERENNRLQLGEEDGINFGGDSSIVFFLEENIETDL